MNIHRYLTFLILFLCFAAKAQDGSGDAILVSSNTYFRINYDNDVFTETDWYYTQGERLEYITPVFAKLAVLKVMLSFKHHAMSYYGISFSGGGYTPVNITSTEIFKSDRPFAGYAYFSTNAIGNDRLNKRRITTQLSLGLIGPAALAGPTQKLIHEVTNAAQSPLGWQNQIKTDLILNYFLKIEKGFYFFNLLEPVFSAEANAGTYLDNAAAGILLRVGRLNSFFNGLEVFSDKSGEAKDAKKWQCYLSCGSKVKVIAYNATMQGGIFHKESPHTLSGSQIERILLEYRFAVTASIKRFGMELSRTGLSKEFKMGNSHQWGSINLSFCF